MQIVIVWILVFGANHGQGAETSSLSPYTYPTEVDCRRVAKRTFSSDCVLTRIYVPTVAVRR